MLDKIELAIIEYLKLNKESSSKVIFETSNAGVSYATLKRILVKLSTQNLITTTGKGKGTKYKISPLYELLQPVDLNVYYQQEIDERQIKDTFNFDLISGVLSEYSLFTTTEISELQELQKIYTINISSNFFLIFLLKA